MNKSSQEISQKLIDPREHNIELYKDLFLRNEKVTSLQIQSMIKELEAIKNYKNINELALVLYKVSEHARNVIYDKRILREFDLITKAYLKKQKEDEFDKVYPLRNLKSINTNQVLLNSILESRI